MKKPKFLIDPHKGVGPIRFGASRSEVAAAMGETPATVDGRIEGYELYDRFQNRSVQVYYDSNELAAGVQFFILHEVVYPLNVRMDGPYEDILKWAREQDPAIVLESDGFRSAALGIVAGVREKDDEDEEQTLRLLVVHRPRYYEDAREWMAAFRAKKKKKKKS
jgi:hypothetical protein